MAEAADLEHLKHMMNRLLSQQDTLSEQQAEMGRNLDGISRDVSKISQTVIGDKRYGQKGLVERTSDLEAYVAKDKLTNAKLLGGLSVIGVIWTFLLRVLLKQ